VIVLPSEQRRRWSGHALAQIPFAGRRFSADDGRRPAHPDRRAGRQRRAIHGDLRGLGAATEPPSPRTGQLGRPVPQRHAGGWS
jgi:hypothetical protein